MFVVSGLTQKPVNDLKPPLLPPSPKRPSIPTRIRAGCNKRSARTQQQQCLEVSTAVLASRQPIHWGSHSAHGHTVWEYGRPAWLQVSSTPLPSCCCATGWVYFDIDVAIPIFVSFLLALYVIRIYITAPFFARKKPWC
ncbi:hypothetical protein ElyMa_000318100 [Elysia marginata]|uniref:Uncharacterized protein n=1 Tax=Elysia marginata TaxID=1093978 RepID=A0AAV4FAX7_9GAST|nr:hypothetical protein ElyMa_000318100 [Elysia marginata]